jgi:putative tryptophan/tyrosine transport system substrate-binding protein
VPRAPEDREPVRRAQAATLSFGMTVTLAPVHDDAEIEGAIATHARAGRQPDQFAREFPVTHRDVIIAVGPSLFALIGEAIYYPRAGGLMSHWFDSVCVQAHAASYIDRILKGASPSDLPVRQPITDHQPQHRQGARSHYSAERPGHCR